MTTPEKSIDEIVEELDKKLEVRFNKCVELCLQQIRGEITEEERVVACEIQNIRALKQITQTLQAERQKREEVVEEAYKKGHADALRTIPIYETNNLTQPNNK